MPSSGRRSGRPSVFLAARAGLAGLAARAGPRVRRLESDFRNNALNYLLVLRLIPIFPFWLVNLVAGAVGLRLWVYVLGTFFGIIPVTFVYASLGNGLGTRRREGGRPTSQSSPARACCSRSSVWRRSRYCRLSPQRWRTGPARPA